MNKPKKIEPGEILIKSEIRLVSLPRHEMKKFLLAEYFRLLQLNSQETPEGEQVKLIIDELYTWLKENWPGCTMVQIRKTLMKGMTSGYDRRIWISFPILISWLTNHRQTGEVPKKPEQIPIHTQAAMIIKMMKDRGIDIDFSPESPDPE